ncbi:MAG: DUF302 domain-containing protein [Sulfitobacter sp.]
MRAIVFALVGVVFATAGFTQSVGPREGWVVIATSKSHADLKAGLNAAVKANKMGVVTKAGPTAAARNRGITIPENQVVGVFNNDFAVRMLALSTAAMIEAPLRFYLTEDPGGTATLSYKTPSFVFAPYANEGGADLVALAKELDARFATIAQAATQ